MKVRIIIYYDKIGIASSGCLKKIKTDVKRSPRPVGLPDWLLIGPWAA